MTKTTPAYRGQKTQAMRLLDRLGVPYRVHVYDPAAVTAQGVAEAIGVPARHVYKTLVMQMDSGALLLAMVPGDREVAVRVLARVLGCKSIRMLPKSQAETVTGLQTGGIGALALTDRPFLVVIDLAALEADEIMVNGGRRGINVQLRVDDLIRVTGARPVSLE